VGGKEDIRWMEFHWCRSDAGLGAVVRDVSRRHRGQRHEGRAGRDGSRMDRHRLSRSPLRGTIPADRRASVEAAYKLADGTVHKMTGASAKER